jgi:hypothetical protein
MKVFAYAVLLLDVSTTESCAAPGCVSATAPELRPVRKMDPHFTLYTADAANATPMACKFTLQQLRRYSVKHS